MNDLTTFFLSCGINHYSLQLLSVTLKLELIQKSKSKYERLNHGSYTVVVDKVEEGEKKRKGREGEKGKGKWARIKSKEKGGIEFSMTGELKHS